MHLMKTCKFTDHGVSEIIGAVLLISVVVVAVAIIGVALTSQGTTQKIPALDAVISNYGNKIQIYHNGGDTLQSSDIKIYVDGNPTTFKKGDTDPAWTSWSPGDSLVTDVTTTPKIVSIIFNGASGFSTVLTTADFTPTGMNNAGPVVTDTLGASFTATPSSGTPPLVVQFMDQSTGYPVSYNWEFGDTQSSTAKNPTHVYNNVGSYTVTLIVTNSTGSTSLISHPVSVTATAPSVISISPISGIRGTSNIPVSVYGTGFANGATISLNKSGSPDISVSSVVFGSTTTLTGTLSLPSGTTTGAWNVVVINPDSQKATLANGFTITDPAGPPTVTSITPGSGATGSTIFITNLSGTNFQTGAQIKLNSSAATDISAANITVVSPTKITCTFYLSGAATGTRNIVVTNPDGQVGMMVSGFTVTSQSVPTVASITPSSGATGSTVFITNLAGTNFQTGAQIKLNSSTASDISAANITVVSPTQITCSFILSGAATGARNVVVTNPDGQIGMLASGFTVTYQSAPTVTSISPNTGTTGSTVFITNLAGTNFQTGAQVKLNSSLASDISAANVTVVSSTQITCTFILSGAVAGARNVVVTNPDGQANLLTGGFTVTSLSTPTVSSISPNTGVNGSTVFITNLAGTNFQSGAQVKLNSSSASDIFAGNLTVVSPTKITCSFVLSGAAGARNVVVINPDGQSAMGSSFTITAAPPAPVTADFTGTPSSGDVPFTVQFVDASLGSPTTWFWNFGDSGTSTLKNPTHSYTTAGTYAVSLMVGNGTGTNTKSTANYITASIPATPLSFYDNFETALSGWTTGGTVARNAAAPRNGVAAARLSGAASSSMMRTVSTSGNSNIVVSFWLGTANNLDAGEYLTADWYDGTSWTQLVQVQNPGTNTYLYYYQYSLPAAAANNANFRIRFSLNSNTANEYGYVDDVRVTGIPG
jgi:PKD repeat protein